MIFVSFARCLIVSISLLLVNIAFFSKANNLNFKAHNMKRSQPTVHTQPQHTVRRVSIDSSEIFLACCVKLSEIFIALRTLAFSSHFPHVAFRSCPRRRFLMQTLFCIVLGNSTARNLTSQCREQNQQPTECFGVNATSHPGHPSERIRYGTSQQIEVLHL